MGRVRGLLDLPLSPLWDTAGYYSLAVKDFLVQLTDNEKQHLGHLGSSATIYRLWLRS